MAPLCLILIRYAPAIFQPLDKTWPSPRSGDTVKYIRGLVLGWTWTRCSAIAERPRCRVR